MRVVLIANPKGGCGKTTLAVNLAGALAARGEKVRLWDLDRQKSALEWLQLRSPELPVIRRLDADDADDIPRGRKNAWLVMDSPAGLHGKNLRHAVKPVDKVLVPIQPSLFDMAATRDFLAVLHEENLLRRKKRFIGIVANRVDARTRAAGTLEAFLRQFELPVLSHLRDTVNYANAAFQGHSLFDLPPYQTEQDREQWAPLLDWIDG